MTDIKHVRLIDIYHNIITEILSIAREKRVNQNTIRPRFTVKKKITLKLGGVKSNA